MSKLYWMSQVIATTDASNISYTPISTSGITSTNVQDALNSVGANMTGVRMSKSLSRNATTTSFTNTAFTDTMYVDYYSDTEVELDGWPTYNTSTHTLTFTFKALKAACNFRIVAKF